MIQEKIIGTEKDKFESKDNYSLHLTNLIRTKIGKKFFPLVNFRFTEIDNKYVLILECEKSKYPVFIHSLADEEEFYIRAGPSSVQIKEANLWSTLKKIQKEKLKIYLIFINILSFRVIFIFYAIVFYL